MSIALQQLAEAGFPERGSVGLRVSVDIGGGGAYFRYVLDQPVEQVWVRFAWRRPTVGTGRVELLNVLDANETKQASLAVSLDTGQLTLRVAQQEVQVTPSLPEAWHQLQLAVNANGLRQLWVDGVLRASITDGPLDSDLAQFEFGCVQSTGDATGSVDLDEWVLSDEEIPAVLPGMPTRQDASDPARWLVLCNLAMPGSAEAAEAYRQARGIPRGHVFAGDWPTQERIPLTQYQALLADVEDYLDRNGLRPLIMGILVGPGMPLLVETDGLGASVPLASLLATTPTHGLPVANPALATGVPDRLDPQAMQGTRITATLADLVGLDAQAWLQRAQSAETSTIKPTAGHRLLVSLPQGSASDVQALRQRVEDWLDSDGIAQLRMPIQRMESSDLSELEVTSDTVAWGWQGDEPPSFSTAGSRVLVGLIRPAETPVTSLQSPSVGGWLDSVVQAGYAAILLDTNMSSTSAVPLESTFFEATRQGWTLGEAFHLASPFLRSGFALLGDPLMTVPWPQAGFDVFAGLDRLEDLDPSRPDLRLPVSETEIAGVESCAAVLRIGDHGVREASYPWACSASDLRPAWPREPGWVPQLEQDSLRLAVIWSRPVEMARITSVQLEADRPGPMPTVLATSSPTRQACDVMLQTAWPQEPTRYRWSVTGQDGTHATGPWSQTILPLQPAQSPELLEVRT